MGSWKREAPLNEIHKEIHIILSVISIKNNQDPSVEYKN